MTACNGHMLGCHNSNLFLFDFDFVTASNAVLYLCVGEVPASASGISPRRLRRTSPRPHPCVDMRQSARVHVAGITSRVPTAQAQASSFGPSMANECARRRRFALADKTSAESIDMWPLKHGRAFKTSAGPMRLSQELLQDRAGAHLV